MQANDAMRILGSAAAMGLLGGGGALAYNATTKPILDEYGNVIESNDINPVMAALGSAAIGAVGGGIYGKMNPASMPIPENPASMPIPEEYLETFRTQTKPVRQVRLQNEIDDLRNEIAITRQGIDEYKKNRKAPEVRQPQPQQSPMVVEPEVTPTQKMPIQESVAEQKRYVPQLSSEQEALYAEAKRLGISPYELEERGWKYNPNQPTIQVVPASPMQMQNPMTPPGMRTVVIQPMKEPGQEMTEEALMLKELAYQQRQQRQMDARLALGAEGWNITENRWSPTNYPEDRQQNVAGWDVINPSPEAASYRRELISDTNRYRQWHENQLEAQKKMM